MHSHDPHGVHVFRHGNFFFLAFGIPVFQKSGKRRHALFFRAVQHFHKASQEGCGIGKTLFHIKARIPLKHRVIGRHQAGLAEKWRQQALPYVRPALAETLVQKAFLLAGAPAVQIDADKFGGFGTAMKDFAGQDGEQGDIVVGTVEKGQQGHGLDNKRMGREQQAVFGNDRNAQTHQMVRHAGRAVIAAHQHQHVRPRALRRHIVKQYAAQTVKNGFAQHFRRVRRNIFHLHQTTAGRVLRTFLPGSRKGAQQAFDRGIHYFRSHILGHIAGQKGTHDGSGRIRLLQKGKEGIVVFHHLTAATPVERQTVTGRRGGNGGKPPVFKDAVKKLRVTVTPAVNGLFDIAHPGQRSATRQRFLHQRAQRTPLLLACILKFVHKVMGKARAQTAERFRHAVIAGQNLLCHMGDEQAGERSLLLLIVQKGVGQNTRHAYGRFKAQGLPQQLPVFGTCLRGPAKNAVGVLHPGVDRSALFKKLGCGVLGQKSRVFIFASGPGCDRFFRICQPGQAGVIGYPQQMVGSLSGGMVKGKQALFKLFVGRKFAVAAQKGAVQKRAQLVQQFFSCQKALALPVVNHGAADLPQKATHVFITLPGFFQQKVQIGRKRFFGGKNGLKVRVQPEVQRGGAHDEMEQAVDGADVQRAHVTHDGVHPAPGRI